MAYGRNGPWGLKPWGHLIGGADGLKANVGTYTISTQSASLNKGDPVMLTAANAQYALTQYYNGSQGEIQLYNPAVAINAANTPNTVIPVNGVAGQPILGSFNGCSYSIGTTIYNQEYWIAGTIATSPVFATVYDDPFIIYDVQLSTYTAASLATNTQFNLMPALQLQNANWPTTGLAMNANNSTIANSTIIGSNVPLLTGSSIGVLGNTVSMATVQVNGVVGANGTPYDDNPTLANYGTPQGNPYGVSTFYACPSLSLNTANNGNVDGRNEPTKNATQSLKILGFTPNPKNVPGAYGVALNGQPATVGNYFNTPFLNVLCIINNHVHKPGTVGVTVA